eukprot:CAMPEP_0113652706 /NCGR_PEP_ID=MMETSP0017_2-20120614/28165_1 /TAXON_ID=2856 /ORGANISM="Cylindrotheca closterium" /LENGTH=829 /DNA_ID=CAMNT_0000565603 /DNA_START=62 /DNA_END=2554 /DNA_ORIENTATION=+ /assembly_acc=CAM_ASM_000147
MSTCTLIQSVTNETSYAPNPFQNTGNIQFYHSNVPRFGNTNEVLNLLQGTSDQQQEYIQGLLATPILLGIFIMAWVIVLWVFNCCRCCFCRNHDWLAGKPVPLPEEPNGKHHDDYKEEIDLENDSADGPTVKVSVYKEKQGSRTGLKLGQNRNGDLIALHVNEKGLFYGKLEVGQRIVSIHGISIDSNPPDDDCVDKVTKEMKTLKDSIGVVTLVVQSTVRKEDVKYTEWKNEYDRMLRQKTIFKSIVTFSLFVLFITGIVLCSAGANGLKSAIAAGVETLDIVEGKMRQGAEFLDDALRLSQSINGDVNSVLVSLNGICPAQTNQICSNLNDPSSCQNLYGLNIVPLMQDAISYTQGDATHEQLIQDARTALDDIANQITNVDTDLDPVNQTLAGMSAFGIVVILISIFLLIVLFIPIPEVVRYALFCLSYGLIFAIILFGFLLLLAVLPASIAVGDVCYNDPGTRVETILRNNMDTSSSSDQIADLVFNIFKGCSAPDARFDESIDFQTEGIGVFGGFDPAIAELKQNAAICGTSSSAIASVESTLNDGVNVHLCEASNILTEFSDFFTCRFWHPIYAQAAHESLCYQGMDALSAITNTLFVILYMSLLIMTFRVALWDAVGSPLRDVSEQKEKENRDETMRTENTKQGEDSSSAEDMIPKNRSKKKRKAGENSGSAENVIPKEKRKKKKKKRVEDFDSADDMIPTEKRKKKKKRKSEQKALEEGMNESEDAVHEARESNAEGVEVHEEEGEMPRKKKKKGEKKKKKKKSPSHEEGEGGVHDRAVEGAGETLEAEDAVDPDNLGKKKKRKKKKKKKKMATEDFDDAQ